LALFLLILKKSFFCELSLERFFCISEFFWLNLFISLRTVLISLSNFSWFKWILCAFWEPKGFVFLTFYFSSLPI
jgi:hypothetical protein